MKLLRFRQDSSPTRDSELCFDLDFQLVFSQPLFRSSMKRMNLCVNYSPTL